MSLKENEYIEKLIPYETNVKDAKFQINFEQIQDCMILDELGNSVRFGDIYQKKKSIIIFLRHFLCFTTSDYVEDLLRIDSSYIEHNNVQIILIGHGDYEAIKLFRKEMRCNFPIFVDPTLTVFAKLKFKSYIDANIYKNCNVHIKSGLMYGILRSTWRAMKYPITKGTLLQGGGAMVVGPGEQIHFFHIEQTMFDKALINDLLISAALEPLSFKQDSRIFSV